MCTMTLMMSALSHSATTLLSDLVSRLRSRGPSAHHIAAAAEQLRQADALLVTAGAGMSADAGLRTYRGADGAWHDHTPQIGGLTALELANDGTWRTHPTAAAQWWLQRRNAAATAEPHAGHQVLASWADQLPTFAVTTNIDGLLQTAGVVHARQVVQAHGSLFIGQCNQECGREPFDLPHTPDETVRELQCPACGGQARPAVLMFGDFRFDGSRRRRQEQRLRSWLQTHSNSRLLIVEVGVGTTIPQLRLQNERLLATTDTRMLRINPNPEGDVPDDTIVLAGAAADVLPAVDSHLHSIMV